MKLKSSVLLCCGIIAVGALCSQAAFANPEYNPEVEQAPLYPAKDYTATPPQRSDIHNTYFGITAGLDHTHFEHKNGAMNISSGDLGWNGGAILGAANSYGSFYIGIEGQLGMSQWDNKNTIGSSTLTIKTPYMFSVDLRPGFTFSSGNSIAYAVLGLGFMETKADVTKPDVFCVNNFKKTVPGLRIGFGIENYLSSSVSLRGEYVYGHYSDIDTEYGSGIDKVDNKFSPSSSLFNLALLFHF